MEHNINEIRNISKLSKKLETQHFVEELVFALQEVTPYKIESFEIDTNVYITNMDVYVLNIKVSVGELDFYWSVYIDSLSLEITMVRDDYYFVENNLKVLPYKIGQEIHIEDLI